VPKHETYHFFDNLWLTSTITHCNTPY